MDIYSLYTLGKMISIYIVLLFTLLTNANTKNVSWTIRVYHDLAEVIHPISKLPLEFTDDDWNHIRSDSITLIGENLNITSQTITEKKKSIKGTEIYIRSPISSDKTTIKLIKAILVDEINSLVKIHEPSIAGDDSLYFTVPFDQIYYREEPPKAKHYVNFTYLPSHAHVLVSYLRSNLNWQTQYQLNLYENRNDLIAMANIRNDGISSVSIDQAELIGGDINLQIQKQTPQFFATARFAFSTNTMEAESSEPTVKEAKELAGIYVFPINKPFTIDAKTNYLLPMFRPHLTVERYALISKTFSRISNTGKAQRSYRLTSDRYLSQGNCIIRELDQIVGETVLPNLAAKNNHEFSIGEDPDIVYKENVTLSSLNTFNETESIVKVSSDKDRSSIVIVTRTQWIYNIHVQLTNYKVRPIKIEYQQQGLHGYRNVSITTTTPAEYSFIQDSSSIKSNITLKANHTESFSYKLVLLL